MATIKNFFFGYINNLTCLKYKLLRLLSRRRRSVVDTKQFFAFLLAISFLQRLVSMAENNKVVFDQLFKTNYVRNKLHSFSCGCSLLKNIPYYSRRGVTDRFTSSENAQLGCVSAWLEGFSRHVNPSGPAQVSFCDCLQGDRVHEARAGHLIKHPYDLKP